MRWSSHWQSHVQKLIGDVQVYYHLGEFEESLTFALGAGKLFDTTSKNEYVETIICKLPEWLIF